MTTLRVIAIALLLLGSALPPAGGQTTLPTPESVLGYKVGADYHLATFEESIGYFERLGGFVGADATDGRRHTSEGRRLEIAFISSAENLAALDRFRDISVGWRIRREWTTRRRTGWRDRTRDRPHRRRGPRPRKPPARSTRSSWPTTSSPAPVKNARA